MGLETVPLKGILASDVLFYLVPAVSHYHLAKICYQLGGGVKSVSLLWVVQRDFNSSIFSTVRSDRIYQLTFLLASYLATVIYLLRI